MANEIGIDVPKSYGEQQEKLESITIQQPIKEIPNSINKVRKKTIRGVLKGDDSSSNQ